MTKNLLAAELARILPQAEYVEMPYIIGAYGTAARDSHGMSGAPRYSSAGTVAFS